MSTNLSYTDFDVHFKGDTAYHSSERKLGILSTVAPSLTFYMRMLLGPVLSLSTLASMGKCDDQAWVRASSQVSRLLEEAGCQLHVEGLENIAAVDGPCIFVGNHMSTLNGFVLLSIIRPYRPVTFVVKSSLATMRLFGPVMQSRNPVVVDRVSPRDDLKTVLEEGCKRLESGLSVVVFPQSTRSVEFSPAKFNSIGVKLAKRSGCPIVPIVMQTHAWSQGRYLKDFGPLKRNIPVRFLFGKPITVQDQGKAEHAEITDFIAETLERWSKE